MSDLVDLESLLGEKENLDAVFEAINDGIVSLDPDLNILGLNSAAAEFFGSSKNELMGRSCFCGDILDEIRDVLEETIYHGHPLKNFSVKFSDQKDDERTVILSTALIRGRDKELTGVILVIHDISEIRKLQRRLETSPAYYKLVGRNKKMQEVYSLIDKVSAAEAPVLIEGESGSGKGLVAEAIHKKSNRRDGPFVKVNCAALSESLLESELFGHAKGAFTGAIRDRMGRFETADKGTIFLDEIGEIPQSTQVKLLNVLQDKTIERVGETNSRKVDVRIISATNRNLKELVDMAAFREDLYYRLKVVRIKMPPLRERPDDIQILIRHFIEKQREETGKDISGVTPVALKHLMRYRWPGNIRELENSIAQAFVLCDDNLIDPDCLPEEIAPRASAPHIGKSYFGNNADEKIRIATALENAGGKKSQAAKALGIDRTTLWRKMKSFDLA